MNLSMLALVAFGLIAARFIFYVFYNVCMHPLRDIPGPFLWRAFDFPYVRSSIQGFSHKDLLRFHEKYGPVVRVGPNEISHTTGLVWKDVWGHNKDDFEKTWKFVPVNGSHGLLTADRMTHRRYRHLFSHAFSQQGLLAQEVRVQGYIDLLIKQLKSRATQGPQDLVEWFNWLTFDIVGDLAFGESFGSLDEMRTHGWVDGFMKGVKATTYMTAFQKYGLLDLLTHLLPKSLQEARMRNYQYVSDKIDARVQHKEPRGDFMDTVLSKPLDSPEKAALLPNDEKHLTRNELKTISGNFVLAGSETTATLLSGSIYELLLHPEIHAELVKEIRETFATPESITISAASSQSPYLLQVLDETLRIYPPVPFVIGRRTPVGGASVAGRYYPAGTGVHICAVAANHSESNFIRPDEFLPERWAKDRRPEFAEDNPDAVFQPFSTGPRNCIGKNLAYAEMRVGLAKMLWWFDLGVPKGKEAEWKTWAEEQKSWVLWEKGSLWVDVKVREDM